MVTRRSYAYGGCLTALVLVVTACSSGAGTHSYGATTTLAVTTTAPAPSHLRGVPVSKFECPSRPVSPTANVTTIAEVEVLLVCPLGMPGPTSKAVTVAATDPQFAVLVTALSAPDEAPTTGACPMYADALQYVFAKTPDGVYQVSIPTDACRHYQQGALDALNQVRQS